LRVQFISPRNSLVRRHEVGARAFQRRAVPERLSLSAAKRRQCGKTTLAKSLLDERGQYLSWDITQDRVLDLERAQEKSGIKIVRLAKWFDALPFESGTR